MAFHTVTELTGSAPHWSLCVKLGGSGFCWLRAQGRVVSSGQAWLIWVITKLTK